MRIERLEPSKRKRGRVLVKLEDGSVLRITEQELLDHGLRAGDELTEEGLRQLAASAACSDAREEGARMLGRKPMSRAELEKKLRRRGASESETASAAEWLTDVGALDDAAYAALLVRHYSASGYGPARCREELRRRGVDRALWEEALAGAPPAEETIGRVLQSRWKGRQPDEKELKRTADALLRRGFSWGDIRAALQRHTDGCLEPEG